MLNQENFKINWKEALSSEEFWNKLSREGTWPQQQLGLSDQLLTIYYSAASEFLAEKNWNDARDAFLFLTFINPSYQNFWLGLGITEQSQAEFHAAIAAYTMAEALNPENPQVLANLLQCHLAVGNKDFAENIYNRLLDICAEKPEYTEIKSKVVEQKQRYDQMDKS